MRTITNKRYYNNIGKIENRYKSDESVMFFKKSMLSLFYSILFLCLTVYIFYAYKTKNSKENNNKVNSYINDSSNVKRHTY